MLKHQQSVFTDLDFVSWKDLSLKKKTNKKTKSIITGVLLSLWLENRILQMVLKKGFVLCFYFSIHYELRVAREDASVAFCHFYTINLPLVF